jgi:putative SOS response-associated peptidase YedK
MCARFTLTTPIPVLAEWVLFPEVAPAPTPPSPPTGGGEGRVRGPRYNIAPTQVVAAVRAATEPPLTLPSPPAGGEGRVRGARELCFLRWGLVPSWADDPAIGNRLINARAETAAEKPSFRAAFRHRRCLIPADGFYEWQKLNGKNQPHYFRMRDGRPFAFAGLWEHWPGEHQPLETCTILTTGANDLVRPVHDRMPVILGPEDFERWLDPAVREPELLQPLLRPFPAEAMTAYPVSMVVNNPRNETPKCVEPAA